MNKQSIHILKSYTHKGLSMTSCSALSKSDLDIVLKFNATAAPLAPMGAMLSCCSPNKGMPIIGIP